MLRHLKASRWRHTWDTDNGTQRGDKLNLNVILGVNAEGRSYLESGSYFIVEYAPKHAAVGVTELKSSAVASKRSSTEPEEIFKTKSVAMEDGNLVVHFSDDQQGI